MTAAADRLARTRLAIIEHIARSQPGRAREEADPAAQEAAAHGRWAGLKAAGRDYWDHHPARMALQMAEPALRALARRHPARLLAGCAVLGALLVLARPWRMVSLTGLLLAALRSGRLSSLALSAWMAGGAPGTHEPPRSPARSSP